jgi:hypothetical protein
MAPVIIELLCEMLGGSSAQSELDSVRDAAAEELGVIAQDLRLDADFRIDVRMVPEKGRRAGSSSRLVLHVDGNTLLTDDRSVPEVIRAYIGELVTARFVNHIWGEWGAVPSLPRLSRHWCATSYVIAFDLIESPTQLPRGRNRTRCGCSRTRWDR